jgi:hypothetical protein
MDCSVVSLENAYVCVLMMPQVRRIPSTHSSEIHTSSLSCVIREAGNELYDIIKTTTGSPRFLGIQCSNIDVVETA